jgi:hypothetical protein
MGGRVKGLRVGCGRQQEGKEQTECFYAAFYDSSPGLVYKALRDLMLSHTDYDSESTSDVGYTELDARPGRLYPLGTGSWREPRYLSTN